MAISLRKILLALVRAYRSWLSPCIPTACACRVLHDTASCSGVIEDALRHPSDASVLGVVRRQLNDCRTAAQVLKDAGQYTDAQGRVIIPCVPFI